MCFGGSKKQKSQTIVQTPPPTAEETELKQLQLLALKQQLAEMGYEFNEFDPEGYLAKNPDVAANWAGTPLEHYNIHGKAEGREFTTKKFEAMAKRALTPEEQAEFDEEEQFTKDVKAYIRKNLIPRDLTPEEQAEFDDEEQFTKDIRAYIRKNLLTEPGGVSEETKAQVGNLFESQRTLGNEEIDRFTRELMGSRGMSATDTPVLREMGLAKSRLETGLRGAESASLLDYGRSQQYFSQALNEFQNQLGQQRLQNVNALNAFQNQLGQQRQLNLNAVGAGAGSAASMLAQIRGMNKTETKRGTGGGDQSSGIFGGLGAMGGFMQGAGNLWSAYKG